MLASGEGFLRTLIGWDKVLQFAESFLAMASFASPKCCPSLACSASCLDRKEDTRITVYHLGLKSCLNVGALMCVFMCICVFFPQHESQQLYSSPFPMIHWFTIWFIEIPLQFHDISCPDAILLPAPWPTLTCEKRKRGSWKEMTGDTKKIVETGWNNESPQRQTRCSRLFAITFSQFRWLARYSWRTLGHPDM